MRLALFSYGFRPFFLLAGLYALLAVAAWLWIYTSGLLPAMEQPPHLWHGHEMLFGFIGAAIGGFLLTAVPSWTGARGFAGTPLVLVTLAWLAGRVAFASTPWLPIPVLTVCELIFIPVLIGLVAPPILRSRNRNLPLLVVLLVFWTADAVFLYGLAGGDVRLASAALRAGINLVMVLVTVIGGRIVPSFTGNALRAQGIEASMRRWAWLEWVVIPAMVLVFLVDLFAPSSLAAAWIAAVAAVAQAMRLSQWQGLKTLRQPIVWVLHAGYAWLPVGLALKAVFLLTGASWSAQWLHALTIGAAATMIMGVMTRASLGHTGRALVVATPIAVAYVLLIVAGLVRVFGPAFAPASYVATVVLAGIFWMAAFGLYVLVYAPILASPRVDGRPG